MKTNQELTVLLVDDDDIEAEDVERTLQKVRLNAKFVRARDGVEGLEMLRGTSGKCEVDRPCIILLDIKMPRMNGIEFLEELRNDPKLSSLVVFMLTTSDSRDDIASAYEHNVAGYIVKSASLDEYSMKLQSVVSTYRSAVEFAV